MSVSSFLQIVNLFFYCLVFIIVIRMLMDNRPSEVLLLWAMILLLIPIFGVFLYFLIGIDWKQRRILKKLPEEVFFDRESELLELQQDLLFQTPDQKIKKYEKIMKLVMESGNSPLTFYNSFQFFFSGADLFPTLFQDVSSAQYYIYMEFFIWRSDALGNSLIDLLIQKKAQGIDVCLLFDGVGSFGRISLAAQKKLKKAGIAFRYFQDPLVRFNNFLINYRNHRKVIVIDDWIAYTGGYNIGEEYLTGGRRFKKWRDTHARIQGQIVRLFKDLFITDWENSNGSPLVEYSISVRPLKKRLYSQIVCSGPDSKWHTIEKLYLALIGNAKKRVLIQSPYFILDRAMQNVLETAALSGVEILVMVAGIPDKWIPFWAAETYFEPLLRTGVRIFRYQEGFCHCKMLVVDDEVVTMGSFNCDIRSFKLSYEANTVIYDEKAALECVNQFNQDLAECREIKLEEVETTAFFKKLRNSISRIPSPLL